MKFAIAAFFAASASAAPFATQTTTNTPKAGYLSKLVEKAEPIRKLESDFPVDISTYYVKFEKCQFVRGFDDNLAQNEDSSTVLGTTRFAIFRLCPGDCSEECSTKYGEYLLDLETYLQVTVDYFKEYEEQMCQACNDACSSNDDNSQRKLAKRRFLEDVDCEQCVDECDKIENMEDNGFVDATKFMDCELIYALEDDDIAYYAAPICTYEGDKIKIGVFSDKNCQQYEQGKNVEDYFEKNDDSTAPKLSHALLKMTYQNTCISCLDEDQQNDQVSYLCQNLYNYAGKCEYSHGFVTGYYGVEGYENQQKQEDMMCNYIKSLKSGTYDETGEINLTGASFSVGGGSSTTNGQKFALTFFVLGTVGLAVYAAMLHSKLTNGSPLRMETGSGALA